MKQIQLGTSGLQVPAIAIGCMRMADMEIDEIAQLITQCVNMGANFFDHADIYGAGECERKFGLAFEKTGLKREDIFLQSKCGIEPGIDYNFDYDYILESVEGILARLKTDYLDVLLLHRPDALMDPREVARAFARLKQEGKVRHFGLSNCRPNQIELLQKYIEEPLVCDQMQFSVVNASMIAQGFETDMITDGAVDRDGGLIEYLRLHQMCLQCWSPFQYGNWDGTFMGNREKFPVLNDTLDALAEKYGVSPTGIAAAWILRLPFDVQLISGSVRALRIAEIIEGAGIRLSRADWYKLYIDAGHILP